MASSTSIENRSSQEFCEEDINEHGSSVGHAIVWRSDEYTSGEHQFQLKIIISINGSFSVLSHIR